MHDKSTGNPFMSVLLGLSEAMRFLTIIPQPWLPPMTERSAVAAIPWFPFAGLIIGALLLPVAWFANLLWGPWVAAAFVIVAWGALTGGLHLDGVSDTFDAVMSWRPRERKLEIMKDSRIGAMGALALIGLLLLKFTLLATALETQAWWVALLLAPVFGRWADLYGIYQFPAAREGGLGRSFHEQVRPNDWLVSSAGVVLLALLIAGPLGLLALVIVWGGTHLLARWWTRDLGGLTGDTYGALCEIGEVVAIAALTVRFLW